MFSTVLVACVWMPSFGPAPVAAEAETLDAIAYCTRADNKLHLISASDLKEIDTYDLGLGAHEMAISRDGRWLVGCAYGGPGAGHQPADNRVVIFDLAARKVHKVVQLEGMKRPNDIVYLPSKADGGRLEALVTVESPPTLVRIDVETGETTLITLKDKAGHMLAVDPSGAIAYIAHVMPGSVSVVDLKAKKVVAKIGLPEGAEGIAISPDGSRLWVASHRADTVSIIDTVKREVIESIPCEGMPFRVRFAPDGSRVAVACPAVGTVAVYDAQDPKKVDRIDVRGDSKTSPTALSFINDGRALAVLCEGPDAAIVRVDLAEKSVTSRRPAAGKIADALTFGRLAAAQ